MATSSTTAASLVDGEMLTTSSLDALQSDDQRKIMDVVDKLRRTGLSSVLQLPQLVVCGDQSSGKSSVLEAITEIPFPRKENLCTRFATEIVLRRDHTPSISTKITPDKTRPMHEQNKLRDFKKSIGNFNELPALIDEATKLMGLDNADSSSVRAFAKDVLSIEICGPGRPQLTLVDLPGLIHAENKSQTKSDVQLIRSLVEEYISNPRTIILAVISAKNDYANQIILQDCRRVDEQGSRTLGIITKPDFLRAGSDNERDWIELAQNKDVYFELGWHMLKNRADDELSSGFEERNRSESLFFSKGRYRNLPQHMVGVEALRERLSLLLSNHLKRELPTLKRELDEELLATTDRLTTLGAKRSTIAEQRQYLTSVSMTIHDILKSAVQGHYEHSFFGCVDTDALVDAPTNVRRLRAVIQHLNHQFANMMRRYGHKYAIPSTTDPDDSNLEQDADSEDERSSPGPLSKKAKKTSVSHVPNGTSVTFDQAANKGSGAVIAKETAHQPAKDLAGPGHLSPSTFRKLWLPGLDQGAGQKTLKPAQHAAQQGSNRPQNQGQSAQPAQQSQPQEPQPAQQSQPAQQNAQPEMPQQQQLQQHTASTMVSINGRKRNRMASTPVSASSTPRLANPKTTVHVPKMLTRPEAVDWVLRILQRSRGRELPGNPNPMLISQLFWQQSEPWQALATEHIERVAATCNEFVKHVLHHVATSEVETRLMSLKVERALEAALAAGHSELKKILDDKQRHPMTYNHYYTTTIQKKRREKYVNELMHLTKDARVRVGSDEENGEVQEYISPPALDNAVASGKQLEQDMDRFSAEEALDSQVAYYKDELKYFVGVVTKQVIERHLVDALPTDIISPLVIAGLTDKEVSYIAAEPMEVTQQRNHLEARREMLQSGQETFRVAMGGMH